MINWRCRRDERAAADSNIGFAGLSNLVAAQLNPVATARGSDKPTDIEEIFGTRLVDS